MAERGLTQAQKDEARRDQGIINSIWSDLGYHADHSSTLPLMVTGDGGLLDNLRALNPVIYPEGSNPQVVDLKGIGYAGLRTPLDSLSHPKHVLTSNQELYHSGADLVSPIARRRACILEDEVKHIVGNLSDAADAGLNLQYLFGQGLVLGEMHKLSFSNAETTTEWSRLEQIARAKRVREGDVDEALDVVEQVTNADRETVLHAYEVFKANAPHNTGLFKLLYDLGTVAMNNRQQIAELRFDVKNMERTLLDHIHAKPWAKEVVKNFMDLGLSGRPIYIVSGHAHLGNLFMPHLDRPDVRDAPTFVDMVKVLRESELQKNLSNGDRAEHHRKTDDVLRQHGVHRFYDKKTGAHMDYTIIDTSKFDPAQLHRGVELHPGYIAEQKPAVIVFDYPLAQQATQITYRLAKELDRVKQGKNVEFLGVLGKAGILEEESDIGDIMLTTNMLEDGTYQILPCDNVLTEMHFAGSGIKVHIGNGITAKAVMLSTAATNRYAKAELDGIQIDLEGVHFLEALNFIGRNRKKQYIPSDVRRMFAYYASDRPGFSMAHGRMLDGIPPTYWSFNAMCGVMLRPH